MFGGWYIIGTREDRAFALVFGPAKSRAEVDKLLSGAANAVKNAGYTVKKGDDYKVAFLVMDNYQPGSCNGQLWGFVPTQEPWRMN